MSNTTGGFLFAAVAIVISLGWQLLKLRRRVTVFQKYFRLAALGSITSLLCLKSAACGTERWPVKTATDKDQTAISAHATPATVNQLSQIAAPINPNIKPDRRYSPTELTIYEVTGKLTVIKSEADQDYHIVLTDEKGRTMIVEAVAPECAAQSRYAKEITAVRKALDDKFGQIDRKHVISQMATVTGVGFFDRIHGQEGVAANGIELHPLVDIIFHDAANLIQLRRSVSGREEAD